VSTIDWTNPACKVTTNFTVKDCLFLPKWNRLANESDGLTQKIKDNLINTCAKLEVIRAFLGNKPIIVHCMFRPPLYNKLVKGATKSTHLLGMGADWHLAGKSDTEGCDDIRAMLVPRLEEFGIRMEDISDKIERNWVHIDTKPPSPNRYFKP